MPDKRIVKTEQKMEAALVTLLSQRPLDKITVTDLVKEAKINKGTFYLHYEDIYAFYDAQLHKLAGEIVDGIADYNLFFDCPAAFMNEYVKSRQHNHISAKALLPNQRTRVYPTYISSLMTAKLYALNRLEPINYNNILLDSVLCGVNYILMKHRDHDQKEAIAAATAMITGTIPYLKFKSKE